MKRLSIWLLTITAACSSAPKQEEAAPIADPMQTVIDQHTKFFRKYDGLYESFRAHATLLTPASQNAILEKRAEFLKWDHKKLGDEKEKSRQEMATQTTVFVQFYSPEVDYNDLNRYNSIWHIYMEIDGRRFEGKARKARGKLIEFQAIYPNYDRFSVAYELTFNVSTANAVDRGAKLVLASTLGEGDFVFSAER